MFPNFSGWGARAISLRLIQGGENSALQESWKNQQKNAFRLSTSSFFHWLILCESQKVMTLLCETHVPWRGPGEKHRKKRFSSQTDALVRY